MDYVSYFDITTEDDDHYDVQVKDPEAVAEDGGEIVDTTVTFENAQSDSISSFTDFVDNFISGTKVGRWFKNFKAGCQFILHMGSLVNDCVSDNPDLPLAASQGKVLMDLITQANSDISQVKSDLTELGDDLSEYCIYATTMDSFLSQLSALSNGETRPMYLGANVVSEILGTEISTEGKGFIGRQAGSACDGLMIRVAAGLIYTFRISVEDGAVTNLRQFNGTSI